MRDVEFHLVDFSRFCVILASLKLPALGNEIKASFHFAFLSFLRNFSFAEVTGHSEMKIKASFHFAFLSFLRNFATDNARTCIIK